MARGRGEWTSGDGARESIPVEVYPRRGRATARRRAEDISKVLPLDNTKKAASCGGDAIEGAEFECYDPTAGLEEALRVAQAPAVPEGDGIMRRPVVCLLAFVASLRAAASRAESLRSSAAAPHAIAAARSTSAPETQAKIISITLA